ncbi:hypothetical protein NE865_03409 [Phthorimaea operculella]|nr:hypothetical protein NE865_03409 [Phthorimaea operculella]
MFGKIAMVTLLASLAAAVQGHSLHSTVQNVNLSPMYIEERTVAAPLSLGAIILKGAKFVGFLIKSAWPLIGFKLGAIALIANLAIWGFKHGFSIILGGLGMLGFCKFTGKCSGIFIPKPVLDIGDTLLYAARQLQNGAELYGNDLY